MSVSPEFRAFVLDPLIRIAPFTTRPRSNEGVFSQERP